MSYFPHPSLRQQPSPLGQQVYTQGDDVSSPGSQSSLSSPGLNLRLDSDHDDDDDVDVEDDASSTTTITPIDEDPAALWQLVYTSSATENAMSPEDLQQILQYSRERNSREDITGLLLYKGGSFAQFLEGPLGTITATYDRIDQDSRHRGVCTLLRRPVEKRDFPRWRMGFSDLGDLAAGDNKEMAEAFQSVVDMSATQPDDLIHNETTDSIRSLVQLFHRSLSRSLWRKQRADSVISLE